MGKSTFSRFQRSVVLAQQDADRKRRSVGLQLLTVNFFTRDCCNHF